MTQEHPITPPPELVRQWAKTCSPYEVPADHIATQAARWGADQELLACGNYLERCAAWEEEDVTEMYNHRRPKPPSLKEQALYALDEALSSDCIHLKGVGDTIRRALESLPN